MIERIYIGCCATDVWLARISVASIRYWHPEIPICLLRDHGRGRFETSEIEKCWSVEAIDSEPRYSGWGYTKLELLFRPLRERFLFVDADTAFVGPLLEVLDARPEQFIVSPDVIDDPRTHHVMGVYLNCENVQVWDPDYEFPGYVFNAGQFVATSGIIEPEDFTEVVEWSVPPALLRRDLFFSADQGFMNYLLVSLARKGRLTLGTATLYYDGQSDEAAQLSFHPPARQHPFLLHWPGEKPPLVSGFARGDILAFFEDFYYSRVPGGTVIRAARAARRLAKAWPREFAVKLYQALPQGVRQMVKKFAGR